MKPASEVAPLPIIALEEQVIFSDVVSASPQDSAYYALLEPKYLEKLKSVGPSRIQHMRAAGIAMQILSHVPVNCPPAACRKANDALHSAILCNPTRFAAFALLSLENPTEAAHELVRCASKLKFVGGMINHHHNGEFLDAERFRPIFASAEQFNIPLYIQSHYPSSEHLQYYRGNYSEAIAHHIATFDLGAHSEVAICVLRLFAAGIFDRFPRLKIIIGQMGQTIPFVLDRIVDLTQWWREKPCRDFGEVWYNNIWVTTSGMFSLAPMACLVNTMPADRIMFSVGYPFSENEVGRNFLADLKASGLVAQAEYDGIAYKNAEKLLGIRVKK
ncbi:putative metal-dependent hydrolase [Mytilinidion resinicola]|uniref:Metal-dependent hydrolase n=1 Tax=Mytilinidion resinicola TaxID=574789 RepID=A0A6A6YZY2_9PEZI|nr:putative metal-dependent hydrolase [Mytilinidion resinicola]KAF2813485.1 putative metal-dependent hydrolase [Mytilinidion resinicola]